MTVEELKARLKTDFIFLVSTIVQNNPEAVNAKAFNLGLTTDATMTPGELFDLVIEARDANNISIVEELLRVPFNKNAQNSTADYSVIFPTSNNSGKMEASDWVAAALGAVGTILPIVLASRNNTNSGGSNTPTTGSNTNGGSQNNSNGSDNSRPQDEPKKDNTVIYIVVGVLGFIVLTVIGFIAYKSFVK